MQYKIIPSLVFCCCCSNWYWMPAAAFVDKSVGFAGSGGRVRRRRAVLRPEEEVEGGGLAPSTPSATSPMLPSNNYDSSSSHKVRSVPYVTLHSLRARVRRVLNTCEFDRSAPFTSHYLLLLLHSCGKRHLWQPRRPACRSVPQW